jgi:CheY-like chemotaxis protein
MASSRNPGGQVKIYSELGEGTAVKGYLPSMAGGSSASVDEAPISATGTLGEVVLVTEDNPAVLEYVVAVLRDLKCQVLQAPDGKSALQILNDDAKADLLLTDIVMPGMNRRELADQARRLRPGLKVIVMTGYSQNGLVHQGHLDPGVHLIQKPLSQTQFANRIRDLVDEPVRAA